MTSSIDITKPVAGTPTTASVRTNFATAKNEIEALQAAVQALQSTTQPLDATLSALAGTITAADRLIYAIGADQFATAALTTYARSLLAAADAPSARAALALGSIATQSAASVSLTGGIINGPVVSRAGLSLGGWHPSRYHAGLGTLAHSTQTLTIGANTLYVVPFAVGDTATFTRLGIDVTAADAGKSARLGIYAWNNGVPTTRLLDAGTVTVASTGIKEVTISQALNAGIYGLALVSDGAPTLRAGDATVLAAATIGTATPGAADYRMSRSFTYGTLPDPWGTPSYGAGTLTLPALYLRIGP